MGGPNLNELTDEQLAQIAGISPTGSSGGAGLDSLTDDQLARLAGIELPSTLPGAEITNPTPMSAYDRVMDWALRRSDGTLLTPEEATLGPLTKSLSGLTGFGDEIIAGGSAAIDRLFRGVPFSEAYEQRVEPLREQAKSFSEASPPLALGLEAAAAIKNPMTLHRKGAGVIESGLRAGTEGALYGGAYGFGEGEGGLENRLDRAATGATVGGIASAPIGMGGTLAGRKLERMAEAAPDEARRLEMSAYGATKPRISKTLDQMPDIMPNDEFQNPIYEAIKSFQEKGGDVVDMDGVALQKELNRQRAELTDKITEKIRYADKQRKKKGFADLQFNTTEEQQLTWDYIKSLPLDKGPAAIEKANEIINAIREESDGTIASYQRAKVQQGELIADTAWGTDSAGRLEMNLRKRIRADLRRKVEDGYAAATGESPDVIAELNKELGQRYTLKPMFADILATQEARNGIKGLIQAFRTSGGLGQTMIAATAGGGLVAGVPAAVLLPVAYAYMHSPQGKRRIARTLGSQPFIEGVKSAGDLFSSAPRSAKAMGLFSARGTAPDVYEEEPAVLPTAIPEKKTLVFEEPAPMQTPSAEALKEAVKRAESNGNPNAVSPKGATGLFQIMPSTAGDIAKELGVQSYNLKDPETSERFYTHYMQKQLDRFQDPKLALAAYNAGPHRVQTWVNHYGTTDWDTIAAMLAKAKKFKETRDYVDKIMEWYDAGYSPAG
jgi:hypothetical protein